MPSRSRKSIDDKSLKDIICHLSPKRCALPRKTRSSASRRRSPSPRRSSRRSPRRSPRRSSRRRSPSRSPRRSSRRSTRRSPRRSPRRSSRRRSSSRTCYCPRSRSCHCGASILRDYLPRSSIAASIRRSLSRYSPVRHSLLRSRYSPIRASYVSPTRLRSSLMSRSSYRSRDPITPTTRNLMSRLQERLSRPRL